MPFDDLLTPVAVPAVQPPKPSSVAAAAATAADVARSVAETTEPRHDKPMWNAERHEVDVGEGWEEVKLHDTLKFGDQIFIKALGVWQDTWGGGLYHKTADIYRRRVTPDEKPLGAFLDEENNQLRAENATLRSEVERLRLPASQVERLNKISTYLRDKGFIGYAADIDDAILKRQGGGE
jgi:hypothetical protein